MNYAFDIGGVISKYPNEMKKLMLSLASDRDFFNVIYIITDMHDKNEVWKTLDDNGFSWVQKESVFCADYAKYGEMCKAVLLRELHIDVFVDDHLGYLQWPDGFGPKPIMLHVQPDARKPYWHESWKCEGGDFGRRVYSDE